MNRIIHKEIRNLNQYVLICLPNEAKWPQEFTDLNEIYLEKTMKQITKKSIALEKTFLYVIQLILFRINKKYSFKHDDGVYDFFNISIALEPNKDTDGEAKYDGMFVLVDCKKKKKFG